MTDFALKVFLRQSKFDMQYYVREENLMAQHERCLPRCIDHATWKLWFDIRPRAGKAGLCEDCTPEYQSEMCSKGKCDHPEILFYVDDHGFLYGSQVPRSDQVALNIGRVK